MRINDEFKAYYKGDGRFIAKHRKYPHFTVNVVEHEGKWAFFMVNISKSRELLDLAKRIPKALNRTLTKQMKYYSVLTHSSVQNNYMFIIFA